VPFVTLRNLVPNTGRELAIVPGTGHGVVVEKPELCNRIVTEFLTEDS
jgi:pimeloyl-ACP methyl ester carboxylesterase